MKHVHDDHRYFEELLEYSCMVVANAGVLMHAAASEGIRNLVQFINQMVQLRSLDVHVEVSDHEMSESIRICSPSSQEVVILQDAPAFAAYMRSTGGIRPNRVSYTVEPRGPGDVVDAPPQEGRTVRTGGDPSRRFEMLTAYVVAGAFERSRSDIGSRYGTDPSLWPAELQFFRHLRNGCFHGNHFNIVPFRGRPQIDSANPPRWHTFLMHSDASMNGKKVVGGFFHMHQVIPFLDDIGRLI